MQNVENLDTIRESQPYFIYQRITLAAPINYFLFPIDYGFWYLLRKIYVKYPEIDATGLIFGPVPLRFETYQRAANKFPQNVPIPFDLVGTPGSAGVSVDAAGNMTATGCKNSKLQNVVHPFRDNIEIQISGQNTATPAVIDIALHGYLIPSKILTMWSGDNE